MHSRPLMTASLSRSRTRRLKPSFVPPPRPRAARNARAALRAVVEQVERGKGPRLSPPGLAPAPGAVQSIGFAGLIVGRDDVSLRAPLFSVDVWAMRRERGGDRGRHPLLLDRKRLPETLLCGLEELDPSFRLWLLVQRQALTRGSRAVSSARSTRRAGSLDSGRPRDRAPEPRSDPRGRLPHPDGGPRGTWRHGRRAQGLQGVVGPPGRRIRQRAVGSDQGPRGPDQDRRVQGQGTRRKRRKRLARAAARSIRSAVESPLLGQRPAVGACRPGA